jgi:hypothetical protein
VHLYAALDERGAYCVLRRKRVAAGSDDLRTRLLQREHETRRLRLEMHDDGELATCKCAVSEPALQCGQHRHVLARPLDAPMPFGRERRISDTGWACHKFKIESGLVRPRSTAGYWFREQW